MRSASSLPELTPALEIAVHRGDLAELARSGSRSSTPITPARLQVMGVDFRLVEIVFHRQGTVCPRRPRKRYSGGILAAVHRAVAARRPPPPLPRRRHRRLRLPRHRLQEPPTSRAWPPPSPARSRRSRFDELSSTASCAAIRSCRRSKASCPRRAPRSRRATSARTSRSSGDFDTYLKGLPDGTGQQWKRRLQAGSKSAPATTSSASPIPTPSSSASTRCSSCTTSAGRSRAAPTPSTAPRSKRSTASPRARLAERGWARLYILHAEGAPRAALYGWKHGDRFAFYQAGYDPEWRQRSVGTVLLGHIVRDCFGDGLAEFDFLRGNESYKLKWANGWRETVRLRARDASLRALIHDAGRTAYWRLREAGKRALSPSPRSSGRAAPARRWRDEPACATGSSRARRRRLRRTGLGHAFRAVRTAASGARIHVLGYHRVVDRHRLRTARSIRRCASPRDAFRRQMEQLRERFVVLPLAYVARAVAGELDAAARRRRRHLRRRLSRRARARRRRSCASSASRRPCSSRPASPPRRAAT